MARIISSRKKYVPVKDLKVYPSNKETIEVIPDDGFNGAHRYRAQMCAGLEMITNFFGPRLQTMCLEIVLFQPLRLIRAHYSLRLTNS